MVWWPLEKKIELLCILANGTVIRTHHTVVLKTCFLLGRQAISTHTVGRKQKLSHAPGDQACVCAIQYEKSPPAEHWKPEKDPAVLYSSRRPLSSGALRFAGDFRGAENKLSEEPPLSSRSGAINPTREGAVWGNIDPPALLFQANTEIVNAFAYKLFYVRIF